MGYPQLGTGVALALGVPAGGQLGFLIEMAMDRILPEAEPRVREILQELVCIEAQMKENRQRAKAAQTGDIKLRAREEAEDLEDLYSDWVDKLSDVFSIGPNPFSHQRRKGEWTVSDPS